MNYNEGIVAEFDSATALLSAAKKIKSSGYTKFETYSPFPIHGMDDAMGLSQSKLGWLAITGGLIGCSGGLALQIWTQAYEYPIIISGKEYASLPAFLPVTFELSILVTAFFTVFGMFALNGLPRWYNAIFNHKTFHKVTDDKFFVSIEADDPKYDINKVSNLLEKLGGKEIELVKENDE